MSDAARFAVRAFLVAGALCACQASPDSAADRAPDRPGEQRAAAAVTSPSFVEFESGQVRPIALSPDGAHLFAVNTPGGTLEIYNVSVSPGGSPGPATNIEGKPAPHVALIVKLTNATGHWEDELHRVWDHAVRFRLPTPTCSRSTPAG